MITYDETLLKRVLVSSGRLGVLRDYVLSSTVAKNTVRLQYWTKIVFSCQKLGCTSGFKDIGVRGSFVCYIWGAVQLPG